MMKWGAASGSADAIKVLQSALLAGAKIFVSRGQLFFDRALLTSKQFSHFTIAPAE
jgi:hypothetical protein